MAAKRIWAVRAQEFIQYDGKNADEVLAFIRPTFPQDYAWRKEDQDGVLVLAYTPPAEHGNAPGEYRIALNSWVGPDGNTTSDADFQTQYVRLTGGAASGLNR